MESLLQLLSLAVAALMLLPELVQGSGLLQQPLPERHGLLSGCVPLRLQDAQASSVSPPKLYLPTTPKSYCHEFGYQPCCCFQPYRAAPLEAAASGSLPSTRIRSTPLGAWRYGKAVPWFWTAAAQLPDSATVRGQLLPGCCAACP